MTGLTDGIQIRPHKRIRRMAPWVMTGVILLTLCTLSWGLQNQIHVGNVDGLHVHAQVNGFSQVSQAGEFVFTKNSDIRYEIQLDNRGSRSLPQVEVQASLHYDGGTCDGEKIFPGARMDGNSVSPLHNVSLAPGRTYSFVATYDVPNNICNGKSHLKVRVQTTQRGRMQARSLISPIKFIFQ